MKDKLEKHRSSSTTSKDRFVNPDEIAQIAEAEFLKNAPDMEEGFLPAKPNLSPLNVTAGNYQLDGVSLTIEKNLNVNEWIQIGLELAAIERGRMFWIGDWMNYGENKYGEKYSQALELTTYTYGTLRNAAWVCQAIPAEIRRPKLSFAHHMEAAAAKPENREKYLLKAEQDGMTQRDFRTFVRLEEGIVDKPAEVSETFYRWWEAYCKEKKIPEAQAKKMRPHCEAAWAAGKGDE